MCGASRLRSSSLRTATRALPRRSSGRAPGLSLRTRSRGVSACGPTSCVSHVDRGSIPDCHGRRKGLAPGRGHRCASGIVRSRRPACPDELRTEAAVLEKSPTRLLQRNGYRERNWETRAGIVELRISRLRKGIYSEAKKAGSGRPAFRRRQCKSRATVVGESSPRQPEPCPVRRASAAYRRPDGRRALPRARGASRTLTSRGRPVSGTEPILFYTRCAITPSRNPHCSGRVRPRARSENPRFHCRRRRRRQRYCRDTWPRGLRRPYWRIRPSR